MHAPLAEIFDPRTTYEFHAPTKEDVTRAIAGV